MRLHPISHDGTLPSRLNDPFDYEPHQLCLRAADEVRRHVEHHGEWTDELSRGKMFGVLIVTRPGTPPDSPCDSHATDAEADTYFLAAYSGLLGGRADHDWFVPAVFDFHQPEGTFRRHERVIDLANRLVALGEEAPARRQLQDLLAETRRQGDQAIARHRELMRQSKLRRDAQRERGEAEDRLIGESQFLKAELRRLKKKARQATSETEERLQQLDDLICQLRQLRKTYSDALQHWLFTHFLMLNAQGQTRNLIDLFAPHYPPAGAGECCAPKLLQYAYAHGLRPIQMAEFWWEKHPDGSLRTTETSGEVRHHGEFYPACRGKCRPILRWMAPPATDHSRPDRPDGAHMLTPQTDARVLYTDDSLCVFNKPAGLLSVPGKQAGEPSVLNLMRQWFPEADGPMMVHRLDQDTSGLLVVAKTRQAYVHLQRQFAAHTVGKTYVALLEGQPDPPTGTVSLPLSPDLHDRPRQRVDPANGKQAITRYEMTAPGRVLFYPETGRTHQLRVHAAHADGLACPIVGDRLYGHPHSSASVAHGRLCLHAQHLSFVHPTTGVPMTFECPAPF